VGDGPSSEVRAKGDFHVFTFGTSVAPALMCGVANLAISAVDAQSSGGGFDYTHADKNVAVADITVQSNIGTTFYLCPTADHAGVYTIDRIHWNGGSGYVYGLYIGSDANFIATVLIRDCIGTAGGVSPGVVWVSVNNADTVMLTNCGFQNGASG